MFKEQNKKYIYKITKLKNIAMFIFLTLFFIGFSFSFEINLKDSISNIESRIRRNLMINIG
jgi:CHASE3 domain sensor protein